MTRSDPSENLPPTKTTMKVTMGPPRGEIPMSYAEAKEIALLRLELRACWDRADRTAGLVALARLTELAGTDTELRGEARRWTLRFDSITALAA
jgi:hypothetical protein